MNVLMQPVKFHFISRLVIERALELMAMANILGSTFQKEEVGVRPPPPSIISSASPFNEGLSLSEIIDKILDVMNGGAKIASVISFFRVAR